MSLLLPNPKIEIDRIVAFISTTFSQQKITNAIIAVSGGIDSALSLTLLAKALPKEHIFPLLLPYGKQITDDALFICHYNNIPRSNIEIVDITDIVELVAKRLSLESNDKVRKGNIMARIRMIMIYDLAKQKQALVCGTENKSEYYLGYFTRFGDEASDLEPIRHLYKTQVRQLAQHLNLPKSIINKAPSAGLWDNQTEETELGFSYEIADQAMEQHIDQKKKAEVISIEGIKVETIQKVIEQIKSRNFKHRVPYHL
jgi:NAD+ synthase